MTPPCPERPRTYQQRPGDHDEDPTGLVGRLSIHGRPLVLDLLEGEILRIHQTSVADGETANDRNLRLVTHPEFFDNGHRALYRGIFEREHRMIPLHVTPAVSQIVTRLAPSLRTRRLT